MSYTIKTLRFKLDEAARKTTFKNALRQYLFDNQEEFFGKVVEAASAEETKGQGEKGHEIFFNTPFTEHARENRYEIVSKLLKKFTYENNKYCVAPDDFIIQNTTPLHITGNDHVIIINAKTKEFAIILKYSRGGSLDTVYKEGLKVLFTNYLICNYFREGDEDIRGQIIHYIKSDKDMYNFINWVENPPKQVYTTTMNPVDYKKLIDWLSILSYHAVPEKKPTQKDLKFYLDKFNLSCKVMFSLAASESSYLTRNSTKHGELTKFYEYAKSYAVSENGVPPSKAHPADVIMVGSVLDNTAMALYYHDGKMSGEMAENAIVCAGISLKESAARWGKVTDALLNFKGEYTHSDGTTTSTTLKQLRNIYLEKTIREEEDNPNVDDYYGVMQNVCKKFKFCHLKQSAFSEVDLDAIANIKKLKDIVIKKVDGVNQKSLNALSIKQMYNIFFTALFASLTKEDIAYLINECLQLASKSYYMVKDNHDKEIPLGTLKITPNMISNHRSIEYTGAGDKKVTRVFIGLDISEDSVLRNALPPTHKNDTIEVDIRQNNTSKEDDKGLNSTIEFK